MIFAQNSKNQEKGFTLTEILVVIFIVALLSALTLVNLREGEEHFILLNVANKLGQDLRTAQEMSMSARHYGCGDGWQMKGYGIYFTWDKDSYFLQARCEDVNNPDTYDDQNIEEIIMERGVKIKELKVDNISPSSLSVFFYPPDPEVVFGEGKEAFIIICLERDCEENTKTIMVNKIGLIAVE